jgi:hypothetical protein
MRFGQLAIRQASARISTIAPRIAPRRWPMVVPAIVRRGGPRQ